MGPQAAPVLGDEIELVPRHLGHLPLVRALISRLGIDRVIDERLPADPRNRISDADCVVAMILNILSGRCALYAMPRFFHQIDTDVLLGQHCPPDALNDDRLASALDHMFEAGTDNLLSEVVSTFLGARDPTRPGSAYSVYGDTTSLTLQVLRCTT
jgi:hypothetical protein